MLCRKLTFKELKLKTFPVLGPKCLLFDFYLLNARIMPEIYVFFILFCRVRGYLTIFELTGDTPAGILRHTSYCGPPPICMSRCLKVPHLSSTNSTPVQTPWECPTIIVLWKETHSLFKCIYFFRVCCCKALLINLGLFYSRKFAVFDPFSLCLLDGYLDQDIVT